MRTYESELETMRNLPKFYLGQEVVSPIGKGIIINLQMPSNGLYLSPEKATATIWFSTEDAQAGWVQKDFSLDELKVITVVDVGVMPPSEALKFMEEQLNVRVEAQKSL